jgi:hypothetical protein
VRVSANRVEGLAEALTGEGRMMAPSGDLPRKMASSGGSSGHMTLAEDEEGGEVPFGGLVHLEWRN